jgi:hypothetical protein
MIEFNKTVERLWAAYDLVQTRFYDDESVNAGHIDSNRYHYHAR